MTNQNGKTRANKARMVLVLFPIGRESGVNFANQSWSVVKQNQTKREITFDTQLKPLHYEALSTSLQNMIHKFIYTCTYNM